MSRLYPFTSRRFCNHGWRQHYLDEGHGPPVVLVHGNPTWSFYYRRLIIALRDRRRVIAPDHIGCGLSDKPDDDEYGYRLSDRIDDLERLLDHCGVDRQIDLVMHDWGGMIAMGYAVRHPERIRRLVVLNTAAFHLPSGKRLPWTLRLGRDTAIGEWLIRHANAFCLGASLFCMRRRLMPLDVRAGYLYPYDSWTNRVAVWRFVRDIPLRPADPSYATVSDIQHRLPSLRDKPMLVCWGEKDFVFDLDFLREWIRRFPEARVLRFPSAGHYVLEDEGESIIPAVQEFLGGDSCGRV